MKYYNSSSSTGKGLINSIINKLPVELHIPGYNYCGPGTKLAKRLARGDRGINELDEACKLHDISYSQNKDNLTERHKADKILSEKAWQRFKSTNASVGEKMSALGIVGAMKAKVKLGMAYNLPNKKTYRKIINKCKKSIEKVKKGTENYLKIIETCLRDISMTTTTTTTTTVKEIRKQHHHHPSKSDRKEHHPAKPNRKQHHPSKPEHQMDINENVATVSLKRKNIDDDDIVPLKLIKSNYEERPKLVAIKRTNKRRLSDDNDDDNIENSAKFQRIA